MRRASEHVKDVIERLRKSIKLEDAPRLKFALGIMRLSNETELAHVDKAMREDGHEVTYERREPGFFGTGAMIITKGIKSDDAEPEAV